MWDKAAICSHILDFLGDAGGPVGEHSLIRHLDERDCFLSFQQEPTNLRLFRKHFVTRHCLYSLQSSLSSDWFLDIGMINICLRRNENIAGNTHRVESSQVGGTDAALRAYYLDLTHLEQASESSVEGLLKSFWQRFAVHAQNPEALAVLELDEAASWADVQIAFRRKAQRAHPDRGGSAAEFAVLQEAYATLRKHFNK